MFFLYLSKKIDIFFKCHWITIFTIWQIFLSMQTSSSYSAISRLFSNGMITMDSLFLNSCECWTHSHCVIVQTNAMPSPAAEVLSRASYYRVSSILAQPEKISKNRVWWNLTKFLNWIYFDQMILTTKAFQKTTQIETLLDQQL